jgi:hypothetical protein
MIAAIYACKHRAGRQRRRHRTPGAQARRAPRSVGDFLLRPDDALGALAQLPRDLDWVASQYQLRGV